MLREDGRNLLREFRKLAPKRKPISVQTWSIRRIGLFAWVTLVAFVVVVMVLSNLRGAGLL
jgi:hypothetical protein